MPKKRKTYQNNLHLKNLLSISYAWPKSYKNKGLKRRSFDFIYKKFIRFLIYINVRKHFEISDDKKACADSRLQGSSPCTEDLAASVEVWLCLVTSRGLQRDVVYIGWPIAPSYMSPNAEGGWQLRGLSQWVQLCSVYITWHGAQINFGDLTSYLISSHIPHRLKIFTWGFIRHAFLFILHEHVFQIYLFKP